MRVKWAWLLGVVALCVAVPAGVSAQDMKTVFGMNDGRVMLLIDRQYSRVSVIVQPILTAYASSPFTDPETIGELDLQWIIPMPAPPVDNPDAVYNVSYYQNELDQIVDLTQVRFEPDEPRYCYDTMAYMGRSTGHGYLIESIMFIRDITAIPNSNPDTVLNQLVQAGYVITPDDASHIWQYAEAGFSLLTVKYHIDAQENPGAYDNIVYGEAVAFTFGWDDAAVPLPFLQNATTWIFSDQAYLPTNVPHVVPDYTQYRAWHTIASTGNGTYYDGATYSMQTAEAYRATLAKLLKDGGGVTEYAGPTTILPTGDETDLLNWLNEEFPYLSRLVIRTPDTAPYPVIAPSLDEPNRSNVIDLQEYVDPLVYWGCSSRTALDAATLENLPAGRMRLDDLRFAAAYPPDWVLSTLPTDTGTVYALSPESLTLEDVKAAANGDTTQPPMFVFAEHIFLTDGFAGPVITEQNLIRELGISGSWLPNLYGQHIRYDMRQEEMEDEHGVQYGIIASEADWAANGALYNAMLTYAQSYQYYASADWPNTLFVESRYRWNDDEPRIGLEIPYPDGWLEHMDGDDIVISGGDAEFRLIPAAQASPEWTQQRYSLHRDLACEQPTIFHAGERAGYIFPTTGYLAEVSAPTEMLGDYIQIMLKMMAALPSACSG